MVSYQKFAKDVGFIGIVQILTSLGTFFLLPIITKTLGTYDDTDSGLRSISPYHLSLLLHLWVYLWVLSDFYPLKLKPKR